MRSNKSYSCQTAFFDLLFNMLLGFAALFILAFAMINENKEKTKSNIEVKAEFILSLTWNDDMDDDVDIYVEDPLGNFISFKRRESGLMHLDRDDLGFKNDIVNTPQGHVQFKQNREIVTLRGFHAGEYCVNLHVYKKGDQRPCTATVQLEKLNPKVETLLVNQTVLKAMGEERTIMRFKLNASGELVSSNTLQKSLISKHNMNPNPNNGR